MHAGRLLRARCAELTQNLPHVRAFSRESLRAFERQSRAISVPHTALTRPRAALTSCALHSARGARRPSVAWTVRIFSRNFARFRTPKSQSQNLGANCRTDWAASCTYIIRVAQRTQCSPAESGGAPKSHKFLIRQQFARFLAKVCALSNPERCFNCTDDSVASSVH